MILGGTRSVAAAAVLAALFSTGTVNNAGVLQPEVFPTMALSDAAVNVNATTEPRG